MSSLDLFFGEGNDLDPDALPPEHRESLQERLARWEDGQGPAFLPRRHGGRLSWYGLFGTSSLRREVQALLPHWLGPAWSDAAERWGAVDPADPFDRRLDEALPNRVVRVDVNGDGEGVDPGARDVVRRRLEELLRLLDARPPRRGGPSKHVSVLLDELDVAATGGNARAAEEMLAELEQRRLLDAPNSTFTEVRVRSLLGQHERVVDPALLERLVGLTLPHGVAIPLARSAHEVFTRAADEASDAEALVAARAAMPRELARILQHVPASTTERAALIVQAVALGATPSFATLLRGRLPDDDHLQGLLEPAPATGPADPALVDQSAPADGSGVPEDPTPSDTLTDVSPPSPADPEAVAAAPVSAVPVEPPTSQVLADLYNDGAHETLIDIAARKDAPLDPESHSWCVFAAHELLSPRTTRAVLDMVERDLGTIDQVEWPKRVLRTVVAELLVSLEADTAVTSWAQWFDLAEAGEAPDEDDLHSAADWPPLGTDELLARLDALADPAALTPVIGRLRAAHLPAMTPAQRGRLGANCLTVLSMAETREASVLSATSDFVRDVVDAGPGDDAIRQTLRDVSDVVDQQLSPGSAEWAVDLASELIDAGGAHVPAELLALLVQITDRLRPALSTVPRSLWRQLEGFFRQVGGELPADIDARLAEDPMPDPLAWVIGKTVFLYSLRERPARQTAARLRDAGAAEVTLSAEHYGTPRLASQVEDKDIVIIVTSESTHSATGVIEHAATTPDLIRVHAAGPSRILEAVERHGTA